MIFYKDDMILVRSMEKIDIEDFAIAFRAQNWSENKERLCQYYAEQQALKRIVLVATYGDCIAGYLTLLPETAVGPFANQRIPEIKDFNVLIKYRRKSIGTKLMDCVEAIAKEKNECISLGVGLYSDYGAVQIMYVKRGYVPDGSGVWHDGKQLKPYEQCINDDALNLYFIKRLN